MVCGRALAIEKPYQPDTDCHSFGPGARYLKMKFVVARYLAVPRLLRLLFEQAMMGAVIGLLLATVLVAADVAGLGTLILGSDVWLVASLLYFFTFALTFASGMIATSMLLNLD